MNGTNRVWRALGTGVLLCTLALTVAGCGGGGGSSSQTVTNNPVPSITSISPTGTSAGGPSFTLTVNGSNFISSSTVQWNSSGRATTFVNATQLTATISSTDIASTGTAQITVINPSPGGGTSNAQTFSINSPVPAITTLSPASAVAGQAAFTLSVSGSNFDSGAVLRWNGNDRTTNVATSAFLTAQILESDVANVGTFPVTVANVGTTSAVSSPVNFSVTAPLPLVVTTSSLPPSADNKGYYFVLAATGGVPPLTWSLPSGSLPSGLTLDSISGLISGTITGATSNFTPQVTDYKSHTASKPLSITVMSSLARNDNVTACGGTDTATPISNGILQASISPYDDWDTYTFTLSQTTTNITIETFAQRLNLDGDLSTRESFLDTVLELLDDTCSVVALNDDLSFDPNHIQDSKIVIGSNPFPTSDSTDPNFNPTDTPAPTSLGAGQYFIRIRDYRGDGRPDFLYDLGVSGIP